MSLEVYGTTAAVFVCAGLAYSLAGYKAKLSKYLRGDPSVKFSPRRIAKTAALGIFLGIVAFGSEELLNGDGTTIAITDPGVFAKQVMITMGIIYSVDKLIIAGSDGGSRHTASRVGRDDADNTAVAQVDEIPPDNNPLTPLPPPRDHSNG